MLNLLNPSYRGAARGPLGSGSIWGDLPRDTGASGKGWHDFTDFKELPAHTSTSGGSFTGMLGRWHAYLDQGATITNPTGGAVDAGIVVGSDGDNECATLITRGKAMMAHTSPKLYFEGELETSTIADTKHGFFFGLTQWGLAATDVLLADDGTLADRNLFGFHRLEGDGDKLDLVCKADGQTAQTLIADAITLVAATSIRVGFKLIPINPIAKRIVVYADGVPLTSFVTTTVMAAATFPSDINMGFGLCVNNATGSTPGTTTFKWIRAAQLPA